MLNILLYINQLQVKLLLKKNIYTCVICINSIKNGSLLIKNFFQIRMILI